MTWDREIEEPGGRAPAPGELAVVQAFLNSADLEDGIERFDAPANLSRWLVNHGLIEATAVLTPRDLERIIEVREALRDHLTWYEDQTLVEAAARLTEALQGVTLAVGFGLNGAVGLQPTTDGVDGALARLMAIVYRAGIEGTWQRMKTCRNRECRWVFYDASKNRSGTWCTMAICGAKRKARAYRRRKSGFREPSAPPTAH